jgi:hypothetical protein
MMLARPRVTVPATCRNNYTRDGKPIFSVDTALVLKFLMMMYNVSLHPTLPHCTRPAFEPNNTTHKPD